MKYIFKEVKGCGEVIEKNECAEKCKISKTKVCTQMSPTIFYIAK